LRDISNFEEKKSEFFLPIVFTPVLHRICSRVDNIWTASIAEADAQVFKNLRRTIPRELFILKISSNSTPREKNCLEKVSRGGAVDDLKFTRQLFSRMILTV
jgi:hypothetical protein